ncbi:MAG: serine/threonine protein kinase [Phycisphaeraceae bacterium]|nr:MAG: serine/threonine protein kinase [Phycisphaeraceae bacterium]
MSSLDGERHEQLHTLFEALIDLDPADRPARARSLCPDDAGLQAEALELCRISDDAPLTMIDAPPPGMDELLDAEGSGEMIGPYRLIRRAGEGGFGVVWEAEQTEPIRRRVAIKLIKPGMDSRQVLRRFDSERRTLARLDHPGIARVLDAGTTPRGRPYFLMDFIDGTPITSYCDEHRLPIAARIGLFSQVCAAIEHAHQRGVIHRDVKASNVLVVDADDGPSVRVIDFGIARALDEDDDGRTRMTRAGQFVGTPASMSPEQLAGEPVDTRTDVYALGVLLYELLTGERPFADASVTPASRESPGRPSTRFTATGERTEAAAEARGARPAEIGRSLRGELDWIVLRAIEHDPERRYASVGEFAADLRRHLSNEPVLARPPSRVYLARKFVARNRALVGAVAVSAAVLVVASVVSVSFALSEAEQRKAAQEALTRADREKRIAEVTSGFMTEGLIAAARPDQLGRDVKMRDAARFAADRIDEYKGLADAPEVEATVRLSIGRTLGQLGEGAAAVKITEPAYEIRRDSLGENDPETLAALIDLGASYHIARQQDEALDAYERAERGYESLYGPDDARTLRALRRVGGIQMDLARDGPAEESLRRAVEGLERLGPGQDRELYIARKTLQNLYANMRRNEEAERLAKVLLAQAPGLFGEGSLEQAGLEVMVGNLALDAARARDALDHFSKAIAIRQKLVGPDDGRLAEIFGMRSYALNDLGRLDKAYADAVEGVRLADKAYGPDSLESLLGCNNALYFGTRVGKFDEAEQYGLRAWKNAPGTRLPQRQVGDNMVELYRAWEKADPGHGHADKAAAYGGG